MIGAENTLFNIPSVTTLDTLFNIPSVTTLDTLFNIPSFTTLPPQKKQQQHLNKIKAQFLKVNVSTFSPYIKQKA